MVDLDSRRFDPLLRVLNRSSSKRDFKILLSPMNIQEVVDNSKEFVS